MNGLHDRVPELHRFSSEPLPIPGTYKVTRTGYRTKPVKNSDGTRSNGFHVIVRRVDYRGQNVVVRWKIQRGANIVTHPDYVGFRNVTNFNPIKPRKLLNREAVRGGGAIFFNEPRKEANLDDGDQDEFGRDEYGKIKWKTARDVQRNDSGYVDDFGIELDEEEDEFDDYDPYSTKFRDYLSSANPWTDNR